MIASASCWRNANCATTQLAKAHEVEKTDTSGKGYLREAPPPHTRRCTQRLSVSPVSSRELWQSVNPMSLRDTAMPVAHKSFLVFLKNPHKRLYEFYLRII